MNDRNLIRWTLAAGIVIGSAAPGMAAQNDLQPEATLIPKDLMKALSFEAKGSGFNSALSEIVRLGGLQPPQIISQSLLEAAGDVSVDDMFERIEKRLRAESADDMDFFVRSVIFFRAAALHGAKPVYRDNGVWNLNPVTNFLQTNLQCGEINRLMVDYFIYAGFDARLVQLTQHQAGEVLVGDRWRYADADMLDFDQFPRDGEGAIVGIAEMNADPRILDRLIPYAEAIWRDLAQGKRLGGLPYPGWVIRPSQKMLDARKAAAEPKPLAPYFYDKRMAKADWQSDIDHGWRTVRRVAFDWKMGTSQSPWKRQRRPSPPWISTIKNTKDGGVSITWKASFDAEKDLAGYRVFAGSVSRGWNYPVWNGRDSLSAHWSGPDRGYDWPGYTRVRLKHLGVEIAKTDQPGYTFVGEEWCGREIFVSITAVDEWGDTIGDTTYMPSSELQIQVPSCS